MPEIEIPIYRSKLEKMGTLMVPHEKIQDTRDAAEVVAPFIQNTDREYLIAVYLGLDGIVMGLELAAMGTANEASTSIRDLIRGALNAGAVAVILAHNHPLSSSVKASPGDIETTIQFKKVAEYHKIKLFDSIIVNCKGEFSSILDQMKSSKLKTTDSSINQAKEDNDSDYIGVFLKLILRFSLVITAFYAIGYLVRESVRHFDSIPALALGGIIFIAYALFSVSKSLTRWP